MTKNCHYCLLSANFLFFSIILITNVLNPVEAKIENEDIYKEKKEKLSAGVNLVINSILANGKNQTTASPNDKMSPAAEVETGSDYKNDSLVDKCEEASMAAYNGIMLNNMTGIISLVKSCNARNKNSPITMDECSKFYTIYGKLMNIPLEFTSKDVLCNLISGESDSKMEPTKNGPVSCSFCKSLHRKANAITRSFEKFFDIFELMCDRLEEADKRECHTHVMGMTFNMWMFRNYQFGENLVPNYCKDFFKCKE